MTEAALVLFAGPAPRWLRFAGGRVVGRGSGFDSVPVGPEPVEESIVAVVPASDVVVHAAQLADLTDLQARAAGRLLVAENSIGAAERLHVAVGPAQADGQRSVVAVDAARLSVLLAQITGAGYDPDHALAAPMLLPRPVAGFVRGDLGGEVVLRGATTAFAEDPALTPLIVADQPVETLEADRLDVAIIDALKAPEADLMQGVFARRRRWSIDWPLVRRAAVLGLAIGLVTIALQVVAILRLNAAAARVEAANATRAAAILPPGTSVDTPLLQVEERLAATRGAGGGFRALAAAAAAAANSTPNVELVAMIFDPDGSLRATARGTAATDLTTFEGRLAALGLEVVPQGMTTDAGRPSRDYVVRVRR